MSPDNWCSVKRLTYKFLRSPWFNAQDFQRPAEKDAATRLRQDETAASTTMIIGSSVRALLSRAAGAKPLPRKNSAIDFAALLMLSSIRRLKCAVSVQSSQPAYSVKMMQYWGMANLFACTMIQIAPNAAARPTKEGRVEP